MTVLQLFSLCSISSSVNRLASLSLIILCVGKNRSFNFATVYSLSWKHGRSFWPSIIISTSRMILSACSCKAMNPSFTKSRNSR